MVVSVLVHRFAPSSRGLQKRAQPTSTRWSSNDSTRRDHYFPPKDDDDDPHPHPHHRLHPAAAATTRQQQERRSTTSHRRKPFKAITCLTSLAADIDIISDWCFYRHARSTDLQCRREQNNAYLIPPLLIHLVLASCVVGTLLWVILATDGRIAAPILRRLGVDKLNMGLVLLLCVFLEDIPQIVLTFVVEDYYDQGGYLSGMALWNVSASLYDSLLKLAEAYDERHDLVETGAWCKHSLYEAHGTNRVVTAVLTLPPAQAARPQQAASSPRATPSSATSTTAPLGTTTTTDAEPTMPQPPSMMPLWLGPAPEASLLLPQPRSLPPLRFLTASVEDGTIKLWNGTSPSSTGSSMMTSTTTAADMNQPYTATTTTTSNGSGDASLFQCGTRPVAAALDVTPMVTVHCLCEFLAQRVTCLALLWLDETTIRTPAGISIHSTATGSSGTSAICFLSGCSNGQVQLWNTDTGLCGRTFLAGGPTTVAAVSSLAVLGDHSFVAGYQDGTARLWNLNTGRCGGVYYHGGTTVGAVCSLNDGVSFVTGSDDQTLRLWRIGSSSSTATTREVAHPAAVMSSTGSSSWWNVSSPESPSNVSTTTPDPLNTKSYHDSTNTTIATSYVQYTDLWPIIHHERNSEKVFVGHTGAVISVTCLGGDASSLSMALVFVSGSRDGTARLWSAVDGTCWQVFRGHSASVTTVTAMDEVTLLTGSADATIKVWDVGNGKCLRTFEGHTAAVTGLSVTHDDSTTFVSSSVDGSVKIWVLTAVGEEDAEEPRAVWDDLLDSNDSWCCRGIDPD